MLRSCNLLVLLGAFCFAIRTGQGTLELWLETGEKRQINKGLFFLDKDTNTHPVYMFGVEVTIDKALSLNAANMYHVPSCFEACPISQPLSAR